MVPPLPGKSPPKAGSPTAFTVQPMSMFAPQPAAPPPPPPKAAAAKTVAPKGPTGGGKPRPEDPPVQSMFIQEPNQVEASPTSITIMRVQNDPKALDDWNAHVDKDKKTPGKKPSDAAKPGKAAGPAKPGGKPPAMLPGDVGAKTALKKADAAATPEPAAGMSAMSAVTRPLDAKLKVTDTGTTTMKGPPSGVTGATSVRPGSEMTKALDDILNLNKDQAKTTMKAAADDGGSDNAVTVAPVTAFQPVKKGDQKQEEEPPPPPVPPPAPHPPVAKPKEKEKEKEPEVQPGCENYDNVDVEQPKAPPKKAPAAPPPPPPPPKKPDTPPPPETKPEEGMDNYDQVDVDKAPATTYDRVEPEKAPKGKAPPKKLTKAEEKELQKEKEKLEKKAKEDMDKKGGKKKRVVEHTGNSESEKTAGSGRDQDQRRKEAAEKQEAKRKAKLKRVAARPKMKAGDILHSSAHFKWRVLQQLGTGGFGDVYRVQKDGDKKDKNEYAMKTEDNQGDKRLLRLKIEVFVMTILNTGKLKPHFVEFVDRGKTPKFKFIVMTLIGPSLEEVRKLVLQKNFSKHSAMQIALQTAESVRDLHSYGFLHRDIKPQNFAIGREKHESLIYMLDFGIARKFMQSKTNKHKVPRANVRFLGTVRYAARACHRGDDQGRKDDLESWLYMTFDLFDDKQGMPWKKSGDRLEVLNLKNQFFKGKLDNVIFDKVPEDFFRIIEYIDSLHYDEEPDYVYVKDVIERIAKEENVDLKKKLDWIGLSKKVYNKVSELEKLTSVDMHYSGSEEDSESKKEKRVNKKLPKFPKKDKEKGGKK